jgi:hypothetical protein
MWGQDQHLERAQTEMDRVFFFFSWVFRTRSQLNFTAPAVAFVVFGPSDV